ncbi:MAG: hypothetical protein E3K37_04930 [Candidatus Kuenenia sp.]|nr:hypothetical protein [Candidatus Kuenenia hertensis]
MARSLKHELIERLNQAVKLLKSKSTEEVANNLMEQYGVSKRQAYRYIRGAQKNKQQLPVPERKKVFTVKLPISVIDQVRKYAKLNEESIGDVTTEALEAFLRTRGHGS